MNEVREAKTTVSASQAGTRLDYWLAKRFTYHTRRQWQQLVRNERVLVNGAPTKVSKKLRAHDLVEYRIPEIAEPVVSTDFAKVYEDNEIVVVDKPGNLPCHPAGRFFRNTLWYLLKKELDDFWIINRLDRETSGLVVLTKKLSSARFMSKQFELGRIVKKYLVLVEGNFPEHLELKGSLLSDSNSEIRKKMRFTPNHTKHGKFVLTNFYKIEEKNGLSLLLAVPKTGKLHQIRASLFSTGYPVVGDKIYGRAEDCYLRFISGTLLQDDRLKLRMSRQALHAYEMHFVHPKNDQIVTVAAPVPIDLKRTLRMYQFDKGLKNTKIPFFAQI